MAAKNAKAAADEGAPVTTLDNPAPRTAEEQALLQEDRGAGQENFTARDMQIPFLTILQTNSPQVNRRGGEYVEGAEPGMIYNTATGALYDQLDVVPAYYHKRYTEWWPRVSDRGEGLVKDHGTDEKLFNETPEDDNRRRTTTDGTIIVDSGTWYVKTVPDAQVAIIAFTSTQLKKSRSWATKSAMPMLDPQGAPFTPPLFARAWRLTTVPESNKKGEWFGWKIVSVGETLKLEHGKDYYLAARQLRADVASNKLAISAQAVAKQIGAEVKSREGEEDGKDIPF